MSKANRISFTVITKIKDFYNSRKEWNFLLEKSEITSPFLTWEWMYSWWENYHTQYKDWKLNILFFFDGEYIIGILPLYVSINSLGLLKYKRVGFLGDRIESSDYLDIITTKEYYSYFYEYLPTILKKEFSFADLIHLTGVLENSIVGQIFRDNEMSPVLQQKYRICPYITLPATYKQYLSKLSKKFRYNINRSMKIFQELSNSHFDEIKKPEDIPQAIEVIFDLHHIRAKQKKINTMFIKEKRYNFHKKCAKRLAENNHVKIFFAYIEDTPIATLYCFEFKDTLFYFQGGFNPQWNRISPGGLIIANAIRYSIAKSLKYFDFMRGDEAYKFKWTKEYYYLYEFYKPLSVKGNILLKSIIVKKYMKKIIKFFTFLNKKSI